MTDQDYAALASFRYAMRKFLRFSKELLANQATLTPEQYEALLALKSFGTKDGLLVGELSNRLQVRHHSTVALTNKLLQRGLVTKDRSNADRRQVSVRLTPAGQQLIEKLAVMHRETIRGLCPEISEAINHLHQAS